jgi:hypothetical protein
VCVRVSVCVSECAPSCSKRIISLTYACARVGDLRCVKIFFFVLHSQFSAITCLVVPLGIIKVHNLLNQLTVQS